MLAVLSPAKKLDFTPAGPGIPITEPEHRRDTQQLLRITQQLTPQDIGRLMKLSPTLSELNYQRFQELALARGKSRVTKQAALAFNGDTYVGFDAPTLSTDDLLYAQEHVRILSGLYGVLRPLDRIRPYRLEMGTALQTPRGRSLYEFWGNTLARRLDRAAAQCEPALIVNLASIEYFKAAMPYLKTPVLNCIFKERRETGTQVIGFCAKRARGMMARYLVETRASEPNALKDFRSSGYRFIKSESTNDSFVFHR